MCVARTVVGYVDSVTSAMNPAAADRGADMPPELRDAVLRVLDDPGRERAFAAWSALHGYDRRMCWNYIDARAFAQWRRGRAEKAARMLATGQRPPRRVRVPRVIRGAADIAAGGL